MERTIYRFVLRHSKREQIVVLLITLLSFPFLYYSLDLPKTIVNDAIGGSGFPREYYGFRLDQVPYLMTLSLVFLALVFINGGFKYYINVYKGQLGERMLRRLRYELYTRILLFRAGQFKRMSQGEIIPMITAEVEPMGGFIGDAFAQPLFQGGTLLVYLAFIFIQDPLLGGAAVALYPFQGYIIPKLQKKVNLLGKQRVRTLRQLSDRIGETVTGVQEIHTHDTSFLHRADFSHRQGDIFDIRFEIYRRKFFVKFLNNFINQLTPFFFYSIGGYLVIEGSLTFGALVAVLAAYKDLAAPWKELLDYYQMKEDIRIKYEQVIEQFQPEDIIPDEQLDADPILKGPFPEEMQFANVSYGEPDGPLAVEGVTLTLNTRRHVALVAGNGQGKDELALLMARLIVPTSGRIRLGEHDFAELPEADTGRRIAYVGPLTHMFTGTLRANLYYGLKHRPAPASEAETAHRRRRIAEARASGNTDLDVQADWVDYQAAGADDAEALQARTIALLQRVDLADDVYRMGLASTASRPGGQPLEARLLEARRDLRARLEADPKMAELVELFDAGAYNNSATVAENLLFGTPVGSTFAADSLAQNPYVLQVLERSGLTQPFLEMGTRMAETMVELFADLPPGHEFFDQFSFISSEDLPVYQALVARVRKDGAARLEPGDRARLMSLPFKMIPSRHRLGLIDPPLEAKLLEARRLFAAELPAELRDAVDFFDAGKINGPATVQDNILFGKIRYGQSGTIERVQQLIGQVVDDLHLRDGIIALGLDYSVGVAGARLSSVQRQKVALARSLLKRPDLLILNEATSNLDGTTQLRVSRAVREETAGRGLVWGVHRPSMAREFDEAIVVHQGTVVGHGPFDEVDGEGTVLRALIEAE